jgi:tyrosyl-tRNA synthetase
MKNLSKIDKVLNNKVEKILPSKEGLKKLMEKKHLRIYFGIDPTSPEIHLGHAICLRKLKEFQELGHKIILLFGTFTAQIGDPSGRDKRRKPLTLEEIRRNINSYQNQISKILDLNKTEIRTNHNWLEKLTFQELNKISSYFTVSQLLERDMFQDRLKKGGQIWLNEFLYPLLQGYDSVVLNVDLEIGGTDQTFNMLIGRKLQRIYHQKEKFVLTTPLLPGLDGRKMSKTFGNVVNIADSPEQMFGKIMSLRDDLILDYFRLTTDFPLEQLKEIEKKLKENKINPRDLKADLAEYLIKVYHNLKKAKEAREDFFKVFKEKKLPKKIPIFKLSLKKVNLVDFLVLTRLVLSKSQAKRLISQRGVKIDGKVISDWKTTIQPKKGMIIQVGKRNFLKLV